MLKKIISGGQTGADIAGLEVAEKFGLETGGWMPFGFLAEDRCHPEYAERFGIQAHSSPSYVPRTRANARDSDGTVRLAQNFESRGEKCTLRAITDYKKLHFDVDLNDPPPHSELAQWITENNIETLNVAGNRESTSQGTHAATTDYLTETLRQLGFTDD